MQGNGLAGLTGRPHAHRAMSSSAAFSPYTSSNRRSNYDGSQGIGNPSTIVEGGYNAIGSARLDGQVVSPPGFGSMRTDEYDRSSQDRAREVARGRLNRMQTLSGSASFELPAPGESSPAGNRIRSRFESFNAGDTNGNKASPFAGNGLGFGGTLANTAGRGSFGLVGSVSATGATFGNTSYRNLGVGYPGYGRDRDMDRPYDGAPTGFSGGFLNVPLPGTSTRSNSFSGGEYRSPRAMISVMPSLPSSAALDHYPDEPRQFAGNLAGLRQGPYRENDSSAQFADTFSDTSSPPSSPRMGSRALRNVNVPVTSARAPARPHSPPRASVFISRSRSQSVAISGLRPTLGSGLIPMPMSTISTAQGSGGNQTSLNAEGGRQTGQQGPASPWGVANSPYSRDAFGNANSNEARHLQDEGVAPVGGSDAWNRQRQADRERDRHTHADLANSIQAALGGLHDEQSRDQQPTTGVHYDGNRHANGNGNGGDANGNSNGVNVRSGASSRRHSVSVVGGPAARTRGFGLAGFGFSDTRNDANAVRRHGPVHQAEREGIYPQPFGGSNGRFRAGDEPQLPTMGSRNIGGYTDADLLAAGFSNRLNLDGNGNQVSVNAAHNGAVPIGRAVSGSLPPFAQDGRLADMNKLRDRSSSPSYRYGIPQGTQGSAASHELARRTPPQASASPQHNYVDSYVSGLSGGQASGAPRVWPNAGDRFRHGPPIGSPTTELPPLSSNAQANTLRESTTASSLGQSSQSHGHSHITSNAGNPGANFGNGNPLDAMYGGGYGFNNGHQAVPAFAPQRVAAPATMPNVGSQPIGQQPGSMGMAHSRVQGQGHFVPLTNGQLPGSHPAQRFIEYPDVRGFQGPQRQPQMVINGNPMGYPPPRGEPHMMAVNAQIQHSGSGPAPNNSADLLGRGVPLTSIELGTRLYIVEFTAKRTDVFYADPPGQEFHEGEVVIVEADRGKDLGTVINDTVTLEEVRAFAAARRQSTAPAPGRQPQVLQHALPQGALLQSQLRGVDVGHADPAETAAVQGLNKEIMPKRIFRVATPGDLQHMPAKRQDEERAIAVCRSKVLQHGLQMNVVAAEYQWDRRKLTFYFTAKRRVDFRDLVKELFRIHKTRIWMACLGGSYLLTDETEQPLDMYQYRP